MTQEQLGETLGPTPVQVNPVRSLHLSHRGPLPGGTRLGQTGSHA